MERPGYRDINQLQAGMTLEEAATKCGVTLDVKGTGKEVRIDCPFGCPGDHCGRKEIAINIENPQKVFKCHAYQCQFRGNLATLVHGFLTQSKPTGDTLRGAEFQRVAKVLAGQELIAPRIQSSSEREQKHDSPTPPPKRNLAFIDAADERMRELHNIDEKFVVDVASMNPVAAAYVRQRPCLSPESTKKWRCGYLPNDGGGDKRAFSLRGNFVYPVLSEEGKVLSWVGRDVNYDAKEREFARLAPAERIGKEPPAKHRFPKGFHRGLELFGQHSSRLREPGYREFIAKHGIIVVEGFNDVIGLDNIGVPAIGIMSNRMTEEQVAKVERWAKLLAAGKVTLLFDADEPGDDGAKESLWLFAQRRLNVRLGWSRAMYNGEFKGRQPESLKNEEWERVIKPALER